MSVRPSARLNGADLHWHTEVADVKNADTLNPITTDWFRHSTQSAIKSASRFLNRHNQQISDQRHITLAARAHYRT